MSQNEKDLLARAKQGEVEAFEQLIREHQRYAYNIAYRMLGHEEDAKDVTQEAFVKAYKSIGRFNGRAKFSTWLYQIVVNACRDHFRKAHPTLSTTDENDRVMAIPDEDTTYGPLERLEREELRRELRECLIRLDPKYREVIILREIREMSYEDIAKVLDVPVGTVRSRISRGREHLAVLARQAFRGDLI